MHIQDAYRVLELDASASAADVRSAFRMLSKVWHPDRFESDPEMKAKAELRIKEVNEAYRTILEGGLAEEDVTWDPLAVYGGDSPRALPEDHADIPRKKPRDRVRILRFGVVIILAVLALLAVSFDWKGFFRRGSGSDSGRLVPREVSVELAGTVLVDHSSAIGASYIWNDFALGSSFRFIPSGEFVMGSPPSEPGRRPTERLHRVKISRSYWLSEFEVSEAAWRRILEENADSLGEHVGRLESTEDIPKNYVSWFEAVAYANKVSEISGLEPCYELGGCRGQLGSGMECASVRYLESDCEGYRLPTEAEWEYAARATSSEMYYDWNLDDLAWYSGNSGGSLHPVGQKIPNRWGLYDLHGNVAEWVWDRFGDYEAGPVQDPSRGLCRWVRTWL